MPLIHPLVFVRANVIKKTETPMIKTAAIDSHIFVIASIC